MAALPRFEFSWRSADCLANCNVFFVGDFVEGWTYERIGSKVGRTEDDVRMLIRRCLASVRYEVRANGAR